MSKELSVEELQILLLKEQRKEDLASWAEWDDIKAKSDQAVINSPLHNEHILDKEVRPSGAYLNRKYYPPVKSEIPDKEQFTKGDMGIIMLEAFSYHLLAIAILFYIALSGI